MLETITVATDVIHAVTMHGNVELRGEPCLSL
jgi:hypothetical protein